MMTDLFDASTTDDATNLDTCGRDNIRSFIEEIF